MRMLLPCLAALIGLVPESAVAELIWPLQQAEGERSLSSSFCEDRGSHLHGGVDMSTGGRVGVPVLAVADGAIVRVKVKYRGLGRAVYLRHPSGLMSVYGHLAGFAEPVRSKIDALIGRKGLYPGDWFPEEPIPVKAGQVIAWSGKTGGGPPHLHFETRRNGGNRPVDPWAEGLPCIDSTPPVIEALAVMPPREGWNERLVKLPTDAPVELDGSELLRLRVADPFGSGTGFVRRLTVSIDDWELYRWDADSYTYGVTKYAGHAFSRGAPLGADPAARGSWLWLLEWPGAGLPFVKGRPALDRWSLGSEGDVRELTIRATDGCGNTSLKRVPLLVQAAAAETPADKLNWVVGVHATSPNADIDAWGRPRGLGGGVFPAPPSARVEPGAGLELKGSGARLSLPAGASETPVYVLLAPVDRSAPMVHPRPALPSEPHPGLIEHGPPVLAAPEALPLAVKATVAFDRPEAVTAGQLGVYRWDPAGKRWQFWGDNVSSSSEVGTTTDRLGTFALMQDTVAPRAISVSRRLVRSQPWRDDADELVASYEEVGEGVAWNGVRFKPSGSDEEWIAEHDPDLDQGAFTLPEELSGERVTGTLVLEDLAGHRVEIPVDSVP